MATKALRQIQIGQEGTPGTFETPTAVWRGIGVPRDDSELAIVEEDVGFLSGTDRAHFTHLLGGISLAETPATAAALYPDGGDR